MVRQGVRGKIVFCTSILGYMSIVGYSAYSPGKHALRGLAEALQSEFMLYGIGVHICFPPTIYTPGYEDENKTKPAVTLRIEAADRGLTPEQVAASILKGMSGPPFPSLFYWNTCSCHRIHAGTRDGHFHITCEFLGDVFRASAAGASPRNSCLFDAFYTLIGFVSSSLRVFVLSF